MAIAFLGLGSNLADREQNIHEAMRLLEEKGIHIIKESSVVETEPVGGPPQGKYLNCVVKVETPYPPLDLLTHLHDIEKILGRVRTIKNAPRTIDLDILLYENMTLNTTDLIVPHPRMMEREFVLKPLAEIAPDVAAKLRKTSRNK
jgi:2-amino-4-hydroxy-6-hydroxymethyldihydropteridine diphosphokinase